MSYESGTEINANTESVRMSTGKNSKCIGHSRKKVIFNFASAFRSEVDSMSGFEPLVDAGAKYSSIGLLE